MYKYKYHVLGVMSGTSLDGIDLAQCFFSISEGGKWCYRLGSCETIGYSEAWVKKLKDAVHFSKGRLKSLDEAYTILLSEVISGFIHKHKIEDLDAVCSHGHTILHRPSEGITLQIGNLKELARLTREQVVCNFRVQDVAYGGQGAPLVPIGDRMLFSEFDFCLNLGGFGNVSTEANGNRIAYDICPVNIVLNRYANKLGFEYDIDGKLASSGKVDSKLINQLNNLSYYQDLPPKSLGLEWVKANVFPLLDRSGLEAADILATFSEHIAIQLSAQFKEGSNVLVTGGGVFNSYLIERLKAQKKLDIKIPSDEIVNFKEALIFGLLGVLRLRDEVNCLASVTGAKQDHSSGVIYFP